MSIIVYGGGNFYKVRKVLHTVCRGILLGYVKCNAIVLINSRNKMGKFRRLSSHALLLKVSCYFLKYSGTSRFKKNMG